LPRTNAGNQKNPKILKKLHNNIYFFKNEYPTKNYSDNLEFYIKKNYKN